MSTTSIQRSSAGTLGAVAILSLSMVWNFESAAVGPALGEIKLAFPGTPDALVQLVSVCPFITSVIFSVVSGKLAERYNKRSIALVGLLIYGISGVLPAFATSIGMMIALRLVTGIGVGLVLPLASQIIVEHYEGRARERMLGLSSATFNLMNIVISLVVGFLLVYGWQMAFYSFVFILVILAVVLIGLPSSPPTQTERREKVAFDSAAKRAIAWQACRMLLVWIPFGTFTATIAIHTQAENLADTRVVGLLISLPAVGSVAAGALYPWLKATLGRWYQAIAVLLIAIGYVSMYLANDVLLLCVGALCIGLGNGAMVPLINGAVATSVTEEQKDIALGVVTACIHLSGIIVVGLLAALMAMVGGGSYRPIFLIYTVTIGLAAVATAVVTTRSQQPTTPAAG